ncbi:MAG TPA: malate dehydrogenase [Candidatus Binatia bacterium]|jgi:malate dehydrogenase
MAQRAKISVIGAGSLGVSVGRWIATRELGDIVLVDMIEGLAERQAADLLASAPDGKFDLKIVGAAAYGETADSDVVIIAAGAAPTPGTSREDLLPVNGKTVEAAAQEAVRWSPDCVLIVATEPVDAMTYLAWRMSGLARNRVVGASGALDSCRLRALLAEELGISARDVQALVLGGHGDEMVPLPRYCTVSGIPIAQLLACHQIQKIIDRTIKAAGIGSAPGTGGAFVAAGVAVAEMAEAIVKDQKRILPCSAYLDGEYGLSDIYFGVPAKLGAGGVEGIVEIELTDEERRWVIRSASRVRDSIEKLNLKLKGGTSDEKSILGRAGYGGVFCRGHGYSSGDIL